MSNIEQIVKLARKIERLAKELDPARRIKRKSKARDYSRAELIVFIPAAGARGISFPAFIRMAAEHCNVSRRVLEQVRLEFIDEDLVVVQAGLMQRTALGDALAAIGREEEPLSEEIQL